MRRASSRLRQEREIEHGDPARLESRGSRRSRPRRCRAPRRCRRPATSRCATRRAGDERRRAGVDAIVLAHARARSRGRAATASRRRRHAASSGAADAPAAVAVVVQRVEPRRASCRPIARSTPASPPPATDALAVLVRVAAQPRARGARATAGGRVAIREARVGRRLDRERVEDRVAVERRVEVLDARLDHVLAVAHAHADVGAIEHRVQDRVARVGVRRELERPRATTRRARAPTRAPRRRRSPAPGRSRSDRGRDPDIQAIDRPDQPANKCGSGYPSPSAVFGASAHPPQAPPYGLDPSGCPPGRVFYFQAFLSRPFDFPSTLYPPRVFPLSRFDGLTRTCAAGRTVATGSFLCITR